MALLLAVATSLPAFCGDEQFNGRWDIKATGQPRAWWLEIDGASTPALKGKFVSAFMGDLNVIEQISIANGELRFGWTRTDRRQNGQPVTWKLAYTARLVNGKLEGTFEVEGQTQQWIGVRAPFIDERRETLTAPARCTAGTCRPLRRNNSPGNQLNAAPKLISLL